MAEDSKSVSAAPEIGANLKILDSLPPPGYLETECVIDVHDRFISLSVSSEDASWAGAGGDQPSGKWKTNSPSHGLLAFASQYKNALLRLDSITIATSKAPKPDRNFKRATICAWCEAFNRPFPTEEEFEILLGDTAVFLRYIVSELRSSGGAAKWNERSIGEIRRAGSFSKVDLSGVDLAGVHFNELDFTNANFDKTNLNDSVIRFADISGASLRECTLENVDGTALHAVGCDFTSASLVRANLKEAKLRDCRFNGANLDGAQLERADLRGSDFSEAKLSNVTSAGTVYDASTILPDSFVPTLEMFWAGGADNPYRERMRRVEPIEDIDFDTFMGKLKELSEPAKLQKALKMLSEEHFQLFVESDPGHVQGIVKSQKNPKLVYYSHIAGDGIYGCCTQNLVKCGGLRSSICKHLLVLVIGLAKSGELRPAKAIMWIEKSMRRYRNINDKDGAAETFIRFRGAEEGQIDWRPTETIPEDYYAY